MWWCRAWSGRPDFAQEAALCIAVRVGNRRRFLAAHRWDWRPTRKVALTFMESAIYSGSNSGVSLKYINPLHPFIFVVDNTLPTTLFRAGSGACPSR